MEQIVLNNAPYIQISVSTEQKLFARQLVEHSLAHHHVPNIWDRHKTAQPPSRLLRYTGSLGEVVFADCYHLPRPTRSFGATDGQDYGQDFVVKSEVETFSLDIKSMKRQSGNLFGNYVLNIPASQLHKPGSLTSYYFCISFHQSASEGTIASLLGFIDKKNLENGETGKLYKSGTRRLRSDGSAFVFNEDTYEVMFREISPPVVTDYVKARAGFRACQLK